MEYGRGVDGVLRRQFLTLMDEDPYSDSLRFGDDSFLFRREGHIDFFRVYRCRSHLDGEKLVSVLEPHETMQEVLEQASCLIREYHGTAKRVGAVMDEALVLKVVEALRRESQGDTQPLAEISDEELTEQFLAESLYREILELPLESVCSIREGLRPLLTPENWRVCLDLLAEFIEGLQPSTHDD